MDTNIVNIKSVSVHDLICIKQILSRCEAQFTKKINNNALRTELKKSAAYENVCTS